MKIFKDHQKWTTNTEVPLVHQVSASDVLDSCLASCKLCSLLAHQLKEYEDLFRKSSKKSKSSCYTVCYVEANADKVELIPGHDETDPYDDVVKESGLDFSFRFGWTNALRYSYQSDFPPPVEYRLMADKSMHLPLTGRTVLTYYQKSLKCLSKRSVTSPGSAVISGLFKGIGSRNAGKTTLNVAHTRTIWCLPGFLNSSKILARKFACYNLKKDNYSESI